MGQISKVQVENFLYEEARYLDDRQWEEWLACYDPNVEFWMPSWADDHQLTVDPKSEISLIYYPTRSGLEDRVFRIKTERSAATIPDTRTSHNINNIELENEENQVVTVRFNWITFNFRYNLVDTYFGFSRYQIDFSKKKPVITKKYVVLKNDYIHHLIDVYHI